MAAAAPPMTLVRICMARHVQPGVVAAAALLGGGYGRGLRRRGRLGAGGVAVAWASVGP
jgi:hypothetical protein